MNATFDRNAALRLFRLLKKSRDPDAQWLRVTAVDEYVIFESGAGMISQSALVLEPGAFTTRRPAFERLLRSFAGTSSMTLQADAGRFRLGAFSGQLLDYVAAPKIPDGFTPPEPGQTEK